MLVLENYTFVPGTSGTGQLIIEGVFTLEDFASITNVTRGAIIYEPVRDHDRINSLTVDSGFTTLTLNDNTEYWNSSDNIQILVHPRPNSTNTNGIGGTLSGSIDAFNRLRVSQGFTLADYKATYSSSSEFLTDKSGSGTVAHQANHAAVRITNSTGATDYIARQSRMYHTYQPGKSQLVLFSFNMYNAEPNANKRIGYYDNRNGVFFQWAGNGSLSFVRRSYVTGSAVDTPVPRSNWSVDKCDGTGPSGFEIDLSKTQLLFIDFQWLGVGRIRIGFVHNGQFVVAHEFYHSNILATPYWNQPSLPVRYEIVNTGTLAQTTYMEAICATVIAEGGYAEAGFDFAASSGIRTVGSIPSSLPLIAIRLKDSISGQPNRLTIRPSSFSCASPVSGVQIDLYRLMSHTGVTNGSWVNASDGSGVQYNISASTYSIGLDDQLIDSFFVPGGQGNNAPGAGDIANPSASKGGFITQNIASNESMAFLLVATSLGNNATAGATIQWREIA